MSDESLMRVEAKNQYAWLQRNQKIDSLASGVNDEAYQFKLNGNAGVERQRNT